MKLTLSPPFPAFAVSTEHPPFALAGLDPSTGLSASGATGHTADRREESQRPQGPGELKFSPGTSMIRGAKKRPTVPLMLPTARTVTVRLTLRFMMRIFSSHLGKEFNRRGDFQLFFGSATDTHVNFYGNEQDVDGIRVAVENAETFVSELDQLRDAPPRPFIIETSADRRRLGRLLGIPSREFQRRLPIGTNHPHGFSRNPDDNDHGDGGASPAVPPPGGPTPILCGSVCPTMPQPLPARHPDRWRQSTRWAGGCRCKEALPN